MMALLVMFACAGSSKDSGTPTDGGGDGGADGGATTATDGGGSTPTDGGTEQEEWLLSWVGEAQLGERWVGEETVVMKRDGGLGATDCEIAYTVESTSTAGVPCTSCLVAYDVVLGAAAVRVGDACAQGGYDAAAIDAIEGETRSYGLALDYLGHSNALMVYMDGRWQPVAFVDWDDATGRIAYQWDREYVRGAR